MIEKILELRKEGKSDTEIGQELELSRQKIGALIRKHTFEEDSKVIEDEFPIEMYSKSSNVIMDKINMGGSVVLTAKEYNEYSEANNRYQGRKHGVETILNPMELRVAITGIQRGDRSGKDVREHLMNKHGIDEDGIRRVAHKLTKEEEITYQEVCRSLGIKG